MDPITLKDVVILKINYLNKNDRVYDMDSVTKIIEDFNTFQSNSITVFGELGSPTSFEISLSNVSHKLDSLRVFGNYLLGDITIIDTPTGNILSENLSSYVFRTRSAGTLGEGNKVIVSQFYTVDAIPIKNDPYST